MSLSGVVGPVNRRDHGVRATLNGLLTELRMINGRLAALRVTVPHQRRRRLRYEH